MADRVDDWLNLGGPSTMNPEPTYHVLVNGELRPISPEALGALIFDSARIHDHHDGDEQIEELEREKKALETKNKELEARNKELEAQIQLLKARYDEFEKLEERTEKIEARVEKMAEGGGNSLEGIMRLLSRRVLAAANNSMDAQGARHFENNLEDFERLVCRQFTVTVKTEEEDYYS